MNLVRRMAARTFSTSKPTALEDDFELINCLGQGSTSRVYLAVDVRTNERVVVKLFKKILEYKIEREIGVLKQIRECPHVQQLREVILNPGFLNYGFVFEYSSGEMMNTRMKDMPLEDIRLYIKQILTALKCVHSKGIMHRDIKPSNILISNDPSRKEARLLDFGLAETMTPEKTYRFRVGTNCYKPPEILLKRTSYNEKVDIWGLGLILMELLLRIKPLFKHVDDEKEMMQRVMRRCPHGEEIFTKEDIQLYGKPKFEGIQEPALSDSGLKLAIRMIDSNPERRPSAKEALEDRFFAE